MEKFSIKIPTNLQKNHIVFLLFVLLFFLPSSSMVGGKSLWYLMSVFLTTSSIIFGLNSKINKTLIFGLSLFCLLLLSVSISLFRSMEYVVSDDFFEIIRTTALCVFFLTSYLLTTKDLESKLLEFFKYFISIQLIICILQKIGPIKKVLSIVWDMDKAWALRSTGTLNNPNTLVLMTIIAFVYIMVYAQARRTKFIFVGIAGLIVVLSGSRTGLLGYLFILIISNLVNTKLTVGFVVKYVFAQIILITALFFVGAYIAEKNPYIGELMRVVEDGNIDLTKVATFSHRVEATTRQFEYFKSGGEINYWIGVGPGKGVGYRVMDNDYAAIFMKYGILGFVLYGVLIFYLLYIGFINRRNNIARRNFIILVLIAFLIFGITGASFLSLFNFIPVLMISGVFLKLHHLEERASYEASIYNISLPQEG